MARNRVALRGEYSGSKTKPADGVLSRSERRAHLALQYAKAQNRAMARAELGVLPGWAFVALKDGAKKAGSLSGVDPKAKRDLLAAAAVRNVSVVKAEREAFNEQSGMGELPTAIALIPSTAAAKVLLKPTDATAPLSNRVSKFVGRGKKSAGAKNLRAASECKKTGTFCGDSVPSGWTVR